MESAICVATEYRQWEFSFELFSSFLEWLGCHQETPIMTLKEAVNILQRWLLSLHQENYNTDEMVPLFPVIVDVNNAENRKLANDLYEKKFLRNIEDSMTVVKKVLDKIETFRNKCYENRYLALEPPEIQTIQTEDNKTKLIIGKCETPPSVRLNYLIENFGLVDTAKMVLRYEAVGNGSYQWGDPVSVHRMYYVEFGARYEGFSSPLNSRFLGKEDARFCSVFHDTDSPFGSLGNFLEVDLSQYEGGWTVNPPFIESILENAARKIIEALESGVKCYFFMNFPNWIDCTGWRLLNESQYKVERYDFSPGEFLIQDAYGASLRPRMKLSIFIVGHLPENCPPVEKIRESIFREQPPDYFKTFR